MENLARPNNVPEGARRFSRRGAAAPALAAALLLVGALWRVRAAPASEKGREPQFTYVGGTEDVVAGCAGMLELTSQAMSFTCGQQTISVPYSAILIMQYRADVSREVRKVKLKLIPPWVRSSKNRFFSVVYTTSGTTHALVLDVPPEEMLPYLAEIDLKSGRRVDVQRHEGYE